MNVSIGCRVPPIKSLVMLGPFQRKPDVRELLLGLASDPSSEIDTGQSISIPIIKIDFNLLSQSKNHLQIVCVHTHLIYENSHIN